MATWSSPWLKLRLRRVERDADGSPASISTALHALEFKCPYPADHKVPVMYKLPKYYACQCLAEMVVLGTHSLVSLSYAAQSATVFDVRFDADLWGLIWQAVERNYDEEHPVKATKLDKQLREIHTCIDVFVDQNVTLLAEVPSVIMTEGSILQTTDMSPFTYSWKKPTLNPEGGQVADLILALTDAKKAVDSSYELMRRKATEVMVWVLSDKDRNSGLQAPTSLPVAYGLKDYKFTAGAMRKATESVLAECSERGLHVVLLATDGQWYKLMVRDELNKPLTIYQLQRDVWDEAKKVSRPAILSLLKDQCKAAAHWEWEEQPARSRRLVAVSHNNLLCRFKTPRGRKVWETKSKAKRKDMLEH